MQNVKLTKRDAFSRELTKRVNEYLKSLNREKSGSWRIFTKVPVLFAFWFVPYILVLTGVFQSFGWILFAGALMGSGMAFIGLSIMHDANHGAFSRFQWVNKVMSYSMEMLGGSSLNWRIQHNVLHHSFTNVHDMDEDIDAPPFLRFSPNAPKRKVHRFQVLYAWFFYGFMTLAWILSKDFVQLHRYHKMNLLKAQGYTYRQALWSLIFWKAVYVFYVVVVPIVFVGVIWWQWLIAFFILHFVCGSILAFVFQSAHVVPETEFVTEESIQEVNPEQSWAQHQLSTTANFEMWNKPLTWFVGGLNYQIEHHLFPDISHVHYPKISKIVKQTAEEFGYAYNYHRTFAGAILAHMKLLHQLGKA
jgi:linoleoyl-CoA desaturase